MKKYLVELSKRTFFVANEEKLKAFQKRKKELKELNLEIQVFELK